MYMGLHAILYIHKYMLYCEYPYTQGIRIYIHTYVHTYISIYKYTYIFALQVHVHVPVHVNIVDFILSPKKFDSLNNQVLTVNLDKQSRASPKRAKILTDKLPNPNEQNLKITNDDHVT